MAGDDTGRQLPPRAVLLALMVPLVVLKLALTFFAPPLADEAYYWLWGQNFALSYYDHPPLGAWLQGVSDGLFGANLFGLRAVALAGFAASAWIVTFWARRLMPSRALDASLAGILLLLASPLFMRQQSFAVLDHVLIPLGMGAATLFALFHDGLGKGEPRWRLYFAGCILLGLAALSKYNAVFIAAGFAIWVLATRPGRALLTRWQLWAGAVLVLAMQWPVIAWNMANDWPSFRYNLDERIGQTFDGSGWGGNLIQFAVNSALFLSPVLVLALARFAMPGRDRDGLRAIGRWALISGVVAAVLLSRTNTVLYYWIVPAYLFAAPVFLLMLRSKWELIAHALYGMTVGAWLMAMHGLYPFYKANGEDVRDYDISYGLSEIAQIVEAEKERLGADMVITTDYRTASLLAFTTGRADVGKIGTRNDQFDFWTDTADFSGKTVLVLADEMIDETDLVSTVFANVLPVREIVIERHGYTMHRYNLYLASGHTGSDAR